MSKVRSTLRTLYTSGPVELTRTGALTLARNTGPGERFLYRRSLAAITDRMDTERNLEDVLDTVLEIKPGYPPFQLRAAQLRDELETLAEVVENHAPRTILEIGTHDGGTFYTWARHVDSAEQIVSLDLPGGAFGGGYSEKKATIYQTFNEDVDMTFVRQNSHKHETFEAVSDDLSNPIDFLFIDGDHTYEGVKQDFEMYTDLCSDDAVVALHDIVTHPDNQEVVTRRREEIDSISDSHLVWGDIFSECNVDDFWAELIDEYETREIISHPKQTWGGIGIVYL
ncbi:class I SAM-dependent methyltransferase [Haloarcula salina]|uniref:class I SAM-dependent methyltransferase n=1 Tax=Haloarcula salina TaxID=1429914 RepID=UPI003C6FD271